MQSHDRMLMHTDPLNGALHLAAPNLLHTADLGALDKTLNPKPCHAEAEPVVLLIPGSVEQRGAVFRTASGDPPYCRSAPRQAECCFAPVATRTDFSRNVDRLEHLTQGLL